MRFIGPNERAAMERRRDELESNMRKTIWEARELDELNAKLGRLNFSELIRKGQAKQS